MATHFSVLTLETPKTEETGGHSPWGHKESHTTQQLDNNPSTDLKLNVMADSHSSSHSKDKCLL